MENLKLELMDAKGSTGVFIDLPLAQIREGIGLVSSSVPNPTEAEAQLKEENEGNLGLLNESREKVAQLEEQLAASKGKTMDDFTPVEKANFVIAWGKRVSLENKAIFAEYMGFTIAGAKVAEVEGEPKTIQGKTDKSGYKYLEAINISVRE